VRLVYCFEKNWQRPLGSLDWAVRVARRTVRVQRARRRGMMQKTLDARRFSGSFTREITENQE
jgi:hypothetical protein